MYKTNLPSEWGTLFGLSLNDLTDEQLRKISLPKLVEFLEVDSRVESVVCEKMLTAPVKELFRLQEVQAQLEKLDNFKAKYNEFLKLRRKEIDNNNDYYYGRHKIIMWNLLDDDNRQHEFTLWTNGLSSVINEDTVDFSWLFSKDKLFADSIVEKILNKRSYSATEALRNMISQLPKEDYLRWIPKIFEKDKYIFIHSLSNQNTPDIYISKSLRVIAKLTHIPTVKVKISNAILNDLPPVTRLEVLEKIIYKCRDKDDMPFSEIKTPDDLKQLVFSSTTRHYDRVSKLIESYTKKINWRD